MKNIKLVFAMLFMVFSQTAFSANDAIKEAERLLGIMGIDTALEQSIEQMLHVQLQQNPALAPYKNVLMEFFSKYMSYESLKPDMVKIYANAFSADELRELNDFYRTPVGMKTIELMPTLMGQGAQLGASRVQENIGELEQMIQAEANRIQELQSE